MKAGEMKYPFEATFKEIQEETDVYISSVFSCLESDFLTMPKGKGFIEYPVFERGYEALKRATSSFSEMTPENIMPVVHSEPISIIVIRSILGFTPPEWAYIATQKSGLEISQGFIRSLDRQVRMEPEKPLKETSANNERVVALVQAACDLLTNVAPSTEYEVIACISGRGFGVRRADMKKLLLATRGKVFTLKTMHKLVECTRLKEYAAKL